MQQQEPAPTTAITPATSLESNTQGKPYAKLASMVARSRLNLPLMRWCIAYAASVKFGCVPEPLRELLLGIFGGFLQSYINEKGNKVMRECERINQASKA